MTTEVIRPSHVEVWHVEQPEKYRVLRERWEYDDETKPPIRHVYEVEAASD